MEGRMTMTETNLNPAELMDAMEALAKANGYGIGSVSFAPRSQPAESDVSYSFEQNHAMTVRLATGRKIMADVVNFTTTKG